MTDKQIVKEFLDLLDCKEGLISTLNGNVVTYKELRTSIINCLNEAMEDGYKKSEAEALFDVSVSQIQKDW